MSSRLLCRSQLSKLTPSRIFYNNKNSLLQKMLKALEKHSKKKEKHPITRWIEYHMTQSQEKDQIAAEFLENSNRLAEYRLLYQEAQRPPIYRMRYPEAFERRSPRALVTGNNCDVSDVNIRKD
ncbi:unnamed protein product [Cunninghamella echinulata]